MKKLLALLLVLGLASMASAALQLSVNGSQTHAAQYTLNPSDTLTLDVWTNSSIGPSSAQPSFAVLATPTATVAGGYAAGVYGTDTDDYLTGIFTASDMLNFEGHMIIPTAANEDGVAGFFVTTSPTVPAGATLYDGIILHCVGQGDATVKLYDVDANFNLGVVLDSIIVHQIPEPMTLVLLGLGGLTMLRRRR